MSSVVVQDETSKLGRAHELGQLCEQHKLGVSLVPYQRRSAEDTEKCPSMKHIHEFMAVVKSYDVACSVKLPLGATVEDSKKQFVVHAESTNNSGEDRFRMKYSDDSRSQIDFWETLASVKKESRRKQQMGTRLKSSHDTRVQLEANTSDSPPGIDSRVFDHKVAVTFALADTTSAVTADTINHEGVNSMDYEIPEILDSEIPDCAEEALEKTQVPSATSNVGLDTEPNAVGSEARFVLTSAGGRLAAALPSLDEDPNLVPVSPDTEVSDYVDDARSCSGLSTETGTTHHQEDKGFYPGTSEIQEDTGFDASKGFNEISALKAQLTASEQNKQQIEAEMDFLLRDCQTDGGNRSEKITYLVLLATSHQKERGELEQRLKEAEMARAELDASNKFLLSQMEVIVIQAHEELTAQIDQSEELRQEASVAQSSLKQLEKEKSELEVKLYELEVRTQEIDNVQRHNTELQALCDRLQRERTEIAEASDRLFAKSEEKIKIVNGLASSHLTGRICLEARLQASEKARQELETDNHFLKAQNEVIEIRRVTELQEFKFAAVRGQLIATRDAQRKAEDELVALAGLETDSSSYSEVVHADSDSETDETSIDDLSEKSFLRRTGGLDQLQSRHRPTENQVGNDTTNYALVVTPKITLSAAARDIADAPVPGHELSQAAAVSSDSQSEIGLRAEATGKHYDEKSDDPEEDALRQSEKGCQREATSPPAGYQVENSNTTEIPLAEEVKSRGSYSPHSHDNLSRVDLSATVTDEQYYEDSSDSEDSSLCQGDQHAGQRTSYSDEDHVASIIADFYATAVSSVSHPKNAKARPYGGLAMAGSSSSEEELSDVDLPADTAIPSTVDVWVEAASESPISVHQEKANKGVRQLTSHSNVEGNVGAGTGGGGKVRSLTSRWEVAAKSQHSLGIPSMGLGSMASTPRLIFPAEDGVIHGFLPTIGEEQAKDIMSWDVANEASVALPAENADLSVVEEGPHGAD